MLAVFVIRSSEYLSSKWITLECLKPTHKKHATRICISCKFKSKQSNNICNKIFTQNDFKHIANNSWSV